MKIIRIDKDRMKILLTREERLRYEIEETASRGDPETRRALRRLLEEAGRQSGFDSRSDRFSVSLFESTAGGCELFVLRLPEEKTGAEALLRLPDARALFRLCRQLACLPVCPAGDLFVCEGVWYLLLIGPCPPAALEFGVPQSAERTVLLREYATPVLRGDAVVRLASQTDPPDRQTPAG